MNPRRLVCGAGLAGALSSCGISADLGEDRSEGPPEAGNGEQGAPDGAPLPPETVVMDLPGVEHGVDDLAVSGDYLYFLAADWTVDAIPSTRLLRCEKRSCTETTVELYRGPEYGSLSELAVIGEQIGMLERLSSTERALTTCVAPNCTDFARIDGLRYYVGSPLFDQGAVEWGQYEDDAVYRCSLPDCEPGPELVVQGIGASHILRSGDVQIFAERGRVWRRFGNPPVLEALELGPETRSLGTPSFDDRLLEDTGPGTRQLIIENEWLYSTTDEGCRNDEEECGIARWPVRGYGPREILYGDDALLGLAAVHDGELVFAREAAGKSMYDYVSCRVEDCEGTLRTLPGGWGGRFVSDSERLYWVTWTLDAKLYSVPRLPRP